jgi:exosortase/archaeosortase family protein
MEKRKLLSIIARYLILLLIGAFIWVIYDVFTPLTIYPVCFLLSLLYDVSLTGTLISFNEATISLIGACIAGSAYYLLLILNLSTEMKAKQRIFSLLFSICLLLLANIVRIVVLSILYSESFKFFDITHKLFWYALSTIFVVGIWFLTVKMFKIKDIPVYSDFKRLNNILRN